MVEYVFFTKFKSLNTLFTDSQRIKAASSIIYMFVIFYSFKPPKKDLSKMKTRMHSEISFIMIIIDCLNFLCHDSREDSIYFVNSVFRFCAKDLLRLDFLKMFSR